MWKNDGIPLLGEIIALVVCCLMAYPADWNYIAVLWVWGFGVSHQRRTVQFSFFSIVAALYCFQPYLYGLNFSPVRIGVVLVLPLLWLYNGEAGHKNKAIQWGYYWFYPLHLLLLHGLQTVL